MEAVTVYDPNQIDPQDEEKAPDASQFSSLLVGAAPSEGATAAGPTPAPAAPASKQHGSGFVNFDRYVSANRDNTAATKANKQATVDSRYSSLITNLGTAQNVPAPASVAPTSTETIVPNSAMETQHEAISNGSATTKDQAVANANAKYSGPTQADVDSKFAPLLTEKNKIIEEANAAKTGYYTGNNFDDALLGAAGGIDYSKTADLKDKYLDAYKAADPAAAESTFNANKSAWQKLLDQYAPTEAANTEAAQQRDRDTEKEMARGEKMKTAFTRLESQFGKDGAAKWQEAIARFSPEEADEFAAMDPNVMGQFGYQVAVQMLYERAMTRNLPAFIKKGN